ncbi:MAG TPA: ATP-grasp domain-containing protein [Methanobacteriaceae archaeon]|nr:ATP-grasp domain-containing protein [Methanobacteriaceae archaeon]HNS25499.1 ATP-grasp domain-containing protein [Methanobacteriaceae archaeon]
MKLMFIGSRLFEDVALYTKNKGITSVLTESNPDAPNQNLADVLHRVPRGMDGPKTVAIKEDVDGVVPLIGVDGPLLSLSSLKEDLEENYGIPVVTSPLEAASIAQSKFKTKRFLTENNFPTPPFQSIDMNLSESYFSFPMVLKQSHGQGGVGIEVVNSHHEMIEYLKKFGNALAEEFIAGVEISVEVLGWKGDYIPLVPVYKGKTSTKGTHPLFKVKKAPLEIEGLDNSKNNKMILELAREICRMMGVAGSADLDLIFDGKENLVLEINTRPSGTRYLTYASCNINPLQEMVDMAAGKWNPEKVQYNLKNYFAMEVPVGDFSTKRNSYLYRNFPDSNGWIIHGPPQHQRITIRGETRNSVLKIAQSLKLPS